MSRNKTLIGLADMSADVQRADNAVRDFTDAQSELTMIRRRIRTFFSAVTQVSFPAIPEAPVWAEDWPEWLETGSVEPVFDDAGPEIPVEETPAP